MAARRRRLEELTIDAPGSATPRPQLAHDGHEGGLNPALAEQRLRLNDAFLSAEPGLQRYPGWVRLAIILGVPSGLWAILVAAFGLMFRG